MLALSSANHHQRILAVGLRNEYLQAPAAAVTTVVGAARWNGAEKTAPTCPTMAATTKIGKDHIMRSSSFLLDSSSSFVRRSSSTKVPLVCRPLPSSSSPMLHQQQQGQFRFARAGRGGGSGGGGGGSASPSNPTGGAFHPYKILGVTPETPPKDVKRAYQRLALKYHPDNSDTGDATKFQAVHDAYNEIKDGKVWLDGQGRAGDRDANGNYTGGGGNDSGDEKRHHRTADGYYAYEAPGSTTENYFADNQRMQTFGMLVLLWSMGFVVIRLFMFWVFPLKGQMPKPPPQEEGGEVGNQYQQQQQQQQASQQYPNNNSNNNVAAAPPSSSASSAFSASSPSTAPAAFSSPYGVSSPHALSTDFTAQQRREVEERENTLRGFGGGYVSGSMSSSSSQQQSDNHYFPPGTDDRENPFSSTTFGSDTTANMSTAAVDGNNNVAGNEKKSSSSTLNTIASGVSKIWRF